jgi:hypothetical protein
LNAFTIALAVLDVAVNALTDPPDRQYITYGDIAVDCDQIVVGIRGITPTQQFPDAGMARVRCGQMPTVEMWVELHRCGPQPDESGNAPTAAALQTFAQTMSDDQESLVCEFLDAIQNNEMTPRPQAWTMRATVPLGPQGDYTGVRVPLMVQVNCTGGGS